MRDKELFWLGSSRNDARAFPEDARMKLKVTRSTGNVFSDVGFS